jgi:hypothetical protein
MLEPHKTHYQHKTDIKDNIGSQKREIPELKMAMISVLLPVLR